MVLHHICTFPPICQQPFRFVVLFVLSLRFVRSSVVSVIICTGENGVCCWFDTLFISDGMSHVSLLSAKKNFTVIFCSMPYVRMSERVPGWRVGSNPLRLELHTDD